MNTKSLFKSISILNILLIIAAIVIANYFMLPLLNITVKYSLPAGKKFPSAGKVHLTLYDPPSSADYVLISEENLFHPERRIPPEKKAEQELPKPEFILYGILISDDISAAYLEDLKAPRNTPGRGKRQVSLKKGDNLSGFTLKEIEQDKIVMIRGEERMIVPLIDPRRPKTREEIANTNVIPPGQPLEKPKKQPAVAAQPKQAPAALVKPEPLTKQRAPMNPADERARGFFQR